MCGGSRWISHQFGVTLSSVNIIWGPTGGIKKISYNVYTYAVLVDNKHAGF